MRNGHIYLSLSCLFKKVSAKNRFCHFFISKNSFLQFTPKLIERGPMLTNETYINVLIARLLSPKLSLYDFHSSSYMNAQSAKIDVAKKGCGHEN